MSARVFIISLKLKQIIKYVSMDNWPTRRARLDRLCMKTGPAMTYNARVDAIAMIITLFCLVFGSLVMNMILFFKIFTI